MLCEHLRPAQHVQQEVAHFSLLQLVELRHDVLGADDAAHVLAVGAEAVVDLGQAQGIRPAQPEQRLARTSLMPRASCGRVYISPAKI